MRLILNWVALLVLLSDCAPTGPHSGPGQNYYGDMEYSNIDKRWYHKNSPTSRDLQSYGSTFRD